MIMKKFMLVLFLVFASFFCFAAETRYDDSTSSDATYVITWQWELEDEDIKYYRFNVNNPRTDRWEKTVNSTVQSWTIRDAKKGEKYTLYLQQSYDGKYWSESAESTVVL